LNLASARDDHSEERPVSTQRHKQRGTNPGELHRTLHYRMVDFRAVEMHEAVAGKEGPAYRMVRDPKSPSQEIGELFWQIMHCDGAEPFAVIDLQAAINDAAEAMGLHQDRVEHGLEITG